MNVLWKFNIFFSSFNYDCREQITTGGGTINTGILFLYSLKLTEIVSLIPVEIKSL